MLRATFDSWRPGTNAQAMGEDREWQLAGVNEAELAWCLVEMFHARLDRQRWRQDLEEGEATGQSPVARDAALLAARRFSPGWWEEQERQFMWVVADGRMDRARIRDFERLFPAGMLLDLFMTRLIAGWYVQHHGDTDEPITAESGLAYLERHRYLRHHPS